MYMSDLNVKMAQMKHTLQWLFCITSLFRRFFIKQKLTFQP